MLPARRGTARLSAIHRQAATCWRRLVAARLPPRRTPPQLAPDRGAQRRPSGWRGRWRAAPATAALHLRQSRAAPGRLRCRRAGSALLASSGQRRPRNARMPPCVPPLNVWGRALRTCVSTRASRCQLVTGDGAVGIAQAWPSNSSNARAAFAAALPGAVACVAMLIPDVAHNDCLPPTHACFSHGGQGPPTCHRRFPPIIVSCPSLAPAALTHTTWWAHA
jgi:hypothetical protein